MKLPTKKQTNLDIAENRRREIQDGVNLAQKVDSLRRELSGLKKQREDYIEQMHLEIEAQITPLLIKKESLEKEVKLLEDKKKWLTTLMNKMKTLLS